MLKQSFCQTEEKDQTEVEIKTTEAPETCRAGPQRKGGWIEKELRNWVRIPWVKDQIKRCVCSGWDFTRFRRRRNTKERTPGKRTIMGNRIKAGAHTELGDCLGLSNPRVESTWWDWCLYKKRLWAPGDTLEALGNYKMYEWLNEWVPSQNCDFINCLQ